MESAIKKNTRLPGINAARFLAPFTSGNLFPLRAARNVWFALTHWETWDWRIKYFMIAPAWFWCCLRARSFWFFTAANPTLTFGGFDGETKMEMYSQLPPGTYPRSILISPDLPFEEVEELLLRQGLAFPLAVKPDVGKMGFMFRTLQTPEDLKVYHENIPCDYILQEFISYPIEISVFYYRLPDQNKGHITGFIQKEYLQVRGDGKSTLWQLILDYPRVRFRLEEMKAKHRNHLHRILARDEVYFLSQALNLSRGGKLVSLEHEKDSRLLKVFDDLSHYSGHFYYGRYDIKCESIEDLKQGKKFSILEFNGSGAEPHHVYGNGYSLWQACSILVWHWNVLLRISQMNALRGFSYWDFKHGLKLLTQSASHSKMLEKLDGKMPGI